MLDGGRGELTEKGWNGRRYVKVNAIMRLMVRKKRVVFYFCRFSTICSIQESGHNIHALVCSIYFIIKVILSVLLQQTSSVLPTVNIVKVFTIILLSN